MNKKYLTFLVVIAICFLSWLGTKAYEEYNLEQLKGEQLSLNHNNNLLRANNDSMKAQLLANELQIEANSKKWLEIEVKLKK